MTNMSLGKKYKKAAGVICKQGMVPFPVNDTTISIMKHVVGDDEDELDAGSHESSRGGNATLRGLSTPLVLH